MNVYKYHGFALCGGVLDNGNKWKNIRLMLTRIPENSASLPRSVELAKMIYTDSALDYVSKLPVGALVDLNCDTLGRVIELKLAK